MVPDLVEGRTGSCQARVRRSSASSAVLASGRSPEASPPRTVRRQLLAFMVHGEALALQQDLGAADSQIRRRGRRASSRNRSAQTWISTPMQPPIPQHVARCAFTSPQARSLRNRQLPDAGITPNRLPPASAGLPLFCDHPPAMLVCPAAVRLTACSSGWSVFLLQPPQSPCASLTSIPPYFAFHRYRLLRVIPVPPGEQPSSGAIPASRLLSGWR